MKVTAEASVIAIVLAFAIVWRYCRDSLRLPPGPRESYFYGVRKGLPRTQPWRTYASWSRMYQSAVISFRVYNHTIIVLNDLKSIHALLDQRANMYSDRPISWMYNVVCGRGKSVFNIAASDPRHKSYRRLLQCGLGTKGTKAAWNVMQSETGILLEGFSTSSGKWQEHIRRHAAAVIMRVAYGYTIDSLDDPFIKVAEETAKISGLATAPGRWLVDYYPLLRFVPSWFPGAQWKQQGRAWKQRLDHLTEVPHNWVKEQIESGTYQDSFTSRLLHPDSPHEKMTSVTSNLSKDDEEDIIKWSASSLYAGASDTTVSALISFVLLMALHPHVQHRAQRELDSTFGDDAITSSDCEPIISTIEQLDLLQYLRAVLKEVLRFAPVGNLALPHCAAQDDEYLGYRIPKGSTVIANVWAIMHDEELYPDPFVFNPERFMKTDKEAADVVQQPDPRAFAFGFGRRVCPGSYFAETSMLLAMASILARFDISLDEGGSSPLRGELEFTTGITSHIKPFPVCITPRTLTLG